MRAFSSLAEAGITGAFAGVLLLLAGCVSQPPPDRVIVNSRTYERSSAVMLDRVVSFLEAEGFTVEGLDRARNVVIATRESLANQDHATCRRFYVRDSDGERRRRAEPVDLRLDLEIGLQPVDAGTLVTAVPAFVGTFRNSFKNLTFERLCQSTGGFERALLDSL